MKSTLTSKGQITIPRAIRERLHLKPGDVLEFDEEATILLARRVVKPEVWNDQLELVQDTWARNASEDATRPWHEQLDDTRGLVE